MKRTLTAVTAAIFATALAFPAFAQVGAGISGNANMGDHSAHAGANADVGNSDAEHTETASPSESSTKTTRHHRKHHSETTSESSSTGGSAESDSHRGVGAGAGVGANVGGMGAHVGAGAKAGSDNSPTGGY
jgi:hypothetical protein